MWFIVVVRHKENGIVFAHISYAVSVEQAIRLVKGDFHPDERELLVIEHVFNTGVTTPVKESI